MKWMVLIVFMLIAGQAFGDTKFEAVHHLSFTPAIKETLVVMKPLSQKRLLPLYKGIQTFPKVMIAARGK